MRARRTRRTECTKRTECTDTECTRCLDAEHQSAAEYWNMIAIGDPKLLRNEICGLSDWENSAQQCLEAISDHLKLKNRYCTFLDLGCGIGRISELVSTTYPKITVIGIDISPQILKRVPQISSVNYLLGDGKSIPLHDSSADAIFSMCVFQHLDPETVNRYMKEIRRVLNPDGEWLIQFVEGDEHSFLNHKYKTTDMIERLEKARLKISRIEWGRIIPEWTWMSGISHDT